MKIAVPLENFIYYKCSIRYCQLFPINEIMIEYSSDNSISLFNHHIQIF